MMTLLIVFVFTLIILHWLITKPKNYPPGPLCLPIIGSVFSVKTKNFHLYLEQIKRYYGPVIGFKFGAQYVVSVVGSREVREVLNREEFQGRPDLPFAKPGIMFSEGQFWSIQRRFTVRHLKDFGFGKKSVENVVMEEAKDFFHHFFNKNETVQVSGLFTVSTINVLWAMIGGERYSHKDKEFKHLLKNLQKTFRAGNVTGGLSNMFPLLRKIFPNLKCFKDEIETENLLDKFLEKAIINHKKNIKTEACDFIDVYLKELEKSELHPSFSEQTLKNICSDFFSAGSESVGNSLGFCVLYCVLYPEWQEELHNEIMLNINSTPYLENKDKFPKIQAFLAEVTRCNTIASLTVPHKALKECTLNNYVIPKGTMVLVSLWSILQDKEYWQDPENFRPKRFLNENGNFKKNPVWLPAFGIGKRMCPGESLSHCMIFTYFIALLREFKFSIPEGHPVPSTMCLPGFTHAPRPFEVKVTKRI